MVEILLNSAGSFVLMIDSLGISSSFHISQALGLEINKYNKILIEKVVQHENYEIVKSISLFDNSVEFDLNSINKEVYIERFKEVFCKELTLLSLNGI